MMKSNVVSIACSMAIMLPCAPNIAATPVELTAPGIAARVTNIGAGPGGRLCIVGQAGGAQGDPRKHGLVVLFDLTKSAVLWQRTAAVPEGEAQVSFVACQTDGRAVVIGADVEVRGRMQAHAWRFDDKGEPVAPVPLGSVTETSRVYAIDADASGVTVAGSTREAKEGGEANAIFFARLDPALRATAVDRLPTGAYLPGAAARLSGNTLYLGGNFAPAMAAAQSVPNDHAVSKIVGNKYRFSVRPLKMPAADVATAVSQDNDIVSLGHAGTTTALAAVDANGKLRDTPQFKSTFCKTGSMGADVGTVYAVRWLCGDAREPAVLVAIDRKTGAELIVSGIVGEPVYVQVLGPQVLVVTRKSNGGLLLQTVAKGQEPD